MKVKIIAVGTEVLTGLTINTNAAYIGNRLTEEGYVINKSVVIADDRLELLKELKSSTEDLIILTGGLGPTVDDFTKEVVSDYLGNKLVHNEEVLERIKERFKQYQVEMDQSNYQQALVFNHGDILQNNHGTAPGFFIDGEMKFALLPGPPKEMIPMFESLVSSKLTLDIQHFHVGYKLVGIGESTCEGKLRGFYEKFPNVEVAPYALNSEIKYLLRSDNQDDLKECNLAFQKLFKDFIIGDYKTNLYEVVMNRLVQNKMKISFAESCTGGMAASKLVDIPGSSQVLDEALVTYANSAKTKYLGVKETTLSTFGAVSHECVTEMVEGLADKTDADVSVAISGVAGPGGGSKEKPVGLVYIGVKVADQVSIKPYHFVGDRISVRERATHMAFRKIYEMLK